MKILKFLSLFLVASLVSLSLASCSDDDDDKKDDSSGDDYSSLVIGQWMYQSPGYGDDETVILNLSDNNEIYHVYTYYPDNGDEYEIIARGEFAFTSDDEFEAVYDDVSVYILGGGNSYRGFTEGRTRRMTYKIESCDGATFVVTDSDGNTYRLERYNVD